MGDGIAEESGGPIECFSVFLIVLGGCTAQQCRADKSCPPDAVADGNYTLPGFAYTVDTFVGPLSLTRALLTGEQKGDSTGGNLLIIAQRRWIRCSWNVAAHYRQHEQG